MRCDRTPVERLLLFHDHGIKGDGGAMLRERIVAYVRGVRGRRQNPVNRKQIQRWFRSTRPDFVDEQLASLCASGKLRCCKRSPGSSRRWNVGYVYEAACESEKATEAPANPSRSYHGNCKLRLMELGMTYPRECEVCGLLGPCREGLSTPPARSRNAVSKALADAEEILIAAITAEVYRDQNELSVLLDAQQSLVRAKLKVQLYDEQ